MISKTAVGVFVVSTILLGTFFCVATAAVPFIQAHGGWNYCGDDVLRIELGEECDDGNAQNGDDVRGTVSVNRDIIVISHDLSFLKR